MAGTKTFALAFGLMSVTVKPDVAKISTPSLAYLCTGQPGHDEHAPSPRRQPPVCEVCGPITDATVLKRGVKSGRTYTLVDGEAAVEAKESYASTYTAALSIVPHPAVDFLAETGQGDTVHYLTPTDASQADHYALLAKLIGEHPELAFVGLYTPSTATSLYHLTVRDGVIVMLKRTREQQMKPLPSVGGNVNGALYDMLDGTLGMFVTDYDPADYEDTYASTVIDLIAAGESVSIEGATVAPTVSDDDLMAKLAALGAKKAPAKKPAAKKAAPRKKATAA